MRNHVMRAIKSVVRTPLFVLLIISVVALAMAYQSRAPIVLEMSSPDEEIYLAQGFYPPEETSAVTFRWTSGDAQMILPGLGSGVPLKIQANLHEFRPSPLVPNPVTIALNESKVISFTPDTNLAAYTFDLPAIADLRGDAIIDLHSDTFLPKETIPNSTDERSLGLFVDQIKLEYGSGLILPPMIVWALLVVSIVAAYAFARAIGLSTRVSFIVGLVLLIAEIIGVSVFRTWTAHNSPWLAGTLVVAYSVAMRLKKGQAARGKEQSSDQPKSKTPALHPQRGASVRNPQSEILLVFLAWRLVLVLIPIIGSEVEGTRECCPEVLPKPATSWQAATFDTWYRWDAIWYGSIAHDGYQYFGTREASNVAFFPGFPLIDGLTHHVTGLPAEVTGPIVSTLLAFAACLLLYRLAQRETGDDETSRRSVVYLLVFPAAYYLVIGYSEALYLVCVLAAFLFAREEKWWLSGLAACVAGLTRLHGALLIVPLGYEYLRQRQWRWRSIFKPQALGVMGAPLGVLVFNVYLNLQFGQPANYFSPYFEIQALFFKGIRAEAFPSFPGTTFANYLHGLLTNVPSTESVAVMGAMILLLVLTVETFARLPGVYGVYMLTVALFSLIGGDLISMPRFVVPMFPGFIALALIGKSPRLDRVILVASLSLQGVLALMFTKGYWIA